MVFSLARSSAVLTFELYAKRSGHPDIEIDVNFGSISVADLLDRAETSGASSAKQHDPRRLYSHLTQT